jgi:hypothetical protein
MDAVRLDDDRAGTDPEAGQDLQLRTLAVHLEHVTGRDLGRGYDRSIDPVTEERDGATDDGVLHRHRGIDPVEAEGLLDVPNPILHGLEAKDTSAVSGCMSRGHDGDPVPAPDNDHAVARADMAP